MAGTYYERLCDLLEMVSSYLNGGQKRIKKIKDWKIVVSVDDVYDTRHLFD